MKMIILLIMIYLHIFDDFHLQGILAQLKQYSYWINQSGYDRKYRNDYWVALFIHGFSWAFLVMLPILIYRWNAMYNVWIESFVVILLGNAITHALIDNMKANLRLINLIQDQLMHIGQIIITFGLFIMNII